MGVKLNYDTEKIKTSCTSDIFEVKTSLAALGTFW